VWKPPVRSASKQNFALLDKIVQRLWIDKMFSENQLTQEEVEFHKRKENWSGGPIFYLSLYFEKNFECTLIPDFLLTRFEQFVWGKKDDTRFKTILKLDDSHTVGLEHSSGTDGYSIGLRPPQSIRLFGTQLEFLEEINKTILKSFISKYIEIARAVGNEFPLRCAIISMEDNLNLGIDPTTARGSIYLDPHYVVDLKSLGTHEYIDGDCVSIPLQKNN
jgi:hypothetical protein